MIISYVLGLPRWCSGKESACQCRDGHQSHGFEPWVGKILWKRKWQSTPVFLPGEPHAATIGRLPFIAEMHRPFSRPGFLKGPRAALARLIERRALRRAAAIILPDEQTLSLFGRHIPRARVTLIPDPHVELVPTAFTFGEFAAAIRHVYEYAFCPKGG